MPDSRRSRVDRWDRSWSPSRMVPVTPWRQILGWAGLLLAGVAVAIGHRMLVWAAILLLGLSLALRLIAAFCKQRSASRTDSVSATEDG